MKLTRRVMTITTLFALAGPSLAAPLGKVVVEAGDADRQGVPVAVALPEGTDLSGWTNLRATDDEGNRYSAQVEAGTQRKVWLILADKLPAGESRTFTLESFAEPASGGVTIADDGKTLVAKIGDREVLAYNHAVVPSPIKEKPQFERSGMLHPVRTPSGKVVTDPMPMPHHTHQHGIMMAWVNTTFEGRHVDFWNSDLKEGLVEHTKVASTTNGSVYGEMVCHLDHVDLRAPEGRKVALHEEWRVRVYNVPEVNLFDITSTQTCASESPLVLNEYHYGGMAVRGAVEWKDAKNCQLVTGDGLGRRRGNHSRPEWVSMSGQLGEGSGGIVVMGSQSNVRHPQPVRLHPDMPYFCFAPVVLDPMRIEPEKPLISSYRFMTHDGELDKELADRIQQSYIHPPKATFNNP